jgi:hypothetical protein
LNPKEPKGIDMKSLFILSVALIAQIAFAQPAFAQPAFAQPAFAQPASSYAGQQTRSVKAYSEAEVADLLAGRGMGLARSAELNAYPGPQHVLELAEKLGLSPAQRSATEALIAPMRAAAQKHGAELIARERELDALFADGRATPERVRAAVDAAATAQARVRQAHLDAHIAQRAILTAEQVSSYQKLRGYDGNTAHGGGGPRGGHGMHGGGMHGHGAQDRSTENRGTQDRSNKQDSPSDQHKH